MSSLYIGGTLEELVLKAFNPRRPISEEEQLQRFRESLIWLVVQARKAAKERAASWRDFRVGCALYAFKTVAYRVEERWRVFTGSNIKITEDSRPVCAEQVAVCAAREAGYDRIIGMVIAGKPQPEEENSARFPTLHPCRECRRLFKSLPEITPDTIFLTILPEGDTYEVHTFEELLKIHGEDNH